MDVLETLTPLDFLDFRSYLMPASGFQSVQFRLIENTFGLLERDRLKVEGHDYVATLREDHAELVRRSESAPSLFDHVERWLTRLPFVRRDGYDFVASYAHAATEMHALARAGIEGRGDLNAEVRRKQLEAFESSVRRFDVVFDRTGWAREVREGGRRFSHEAFMAALFISLYREDPILQVPFQILESLIDIDETLTLWRQRHALMAHRMLGRLVGSAGSGYAYLDETAKRYTPFKDLFDVSTYLLPRVDRPAVAGASALRHVRVGDALVGGDIVVVRSSPAARHRLRRGLDVRLRALGVGPGDVRHRLGRRLGPARRHLGR